MIEDVSFEVLKAQSKILVPASPKRSPNQRPDYSRNEPFEKQMHEQTEWSGDFLKQVREYKKIGLDRISEITKISGFYINAIEKMESQNLPALVYVRGYVGQLCRVLGLEEKKVCDSYMKLYKDKLAKK